MRMHVNPEHIGCDTIRKFLFDYVERDLDPRVLMAMDNHTLACAKCHDLVEGYKLSIESARIRMKRDEHMPDQFRLEILRTLKEEDKGQ